MTDFSADEGNGGVLRYQVRELLRQVASLFQWKSEVDQERVKLRTTAETLAEDMKKLTDAVDSLRKTFLGFIITLAMASITFSLTVLAATGKIP